MDDDQGDEMEMEVTFDNFDREINGDDAEDEYNVDTDDEYDRERFDHESGDDMTRAHEVSGQLQGFFQQIFPGPGRSRSRGQNSRNGSSAENMELSVEFMIEGPGGNTLNSSIYPISMDNHSGIPLGLISSSTRAEGNSSVISSSEEVSGEQEPSIQNTGERDIERYSSDDEDDEIDENNSEDSYPNEDENEVRHCDEPVTDF